MRYHARMADDLTGVPTAALAELHYRSHAHTVALALLWLALALLVAVLARKGVIGWPDMVAWRG